MRQERQTETETDAIDRGRSDRQRQERQTGTGPTDRNRYRNERGVQRGTNDVLREREHKIKGNDSSKLGQQMGIWGHKSDHYL
jgi:hypothetical protein